ncbi:lysophospholipid acyltransferase family protein [Algoriphagus sp. D3-2-R+10]|uniref:lysophospholipid acyltransferase family protein n=1 Tax=Algoriphagus aurantiacus TaxID=3103948 RepID=UPI002B3D387D|nr:lysophospholipid acyltransferase family protein [Algoriphagus sp. D3-2-R+10]MEB2776458.1 lysophospholipid acyltransferase family protein [Algoriphagus sp. D3-2-R+10]
MIKIIQAIFTIYSIVLFFTLLLILGLFIVIPLSISPTGGKLSFLFIRIWARVWSFGSGIRYEFHGRDIIDRTQPYIYIFNHRSFLDAAIIPLAIPQPVRALGKKELSKIPFFGWVVGKVAIWVDRTDAESRRKSIGRLVTFLNQGISAVVAPEGTRNDSESALLPFKSGAFRLSIETRIPILPIAVIGANKIMKKGSLLISPGKVKIYYSKPIYPPSTSDNAVNELLEKCQSRLEAMLLTHE